MTVVRAFSGALVRQAWAGRVVAPMYDSLPLARREEVLATNPDSYLHVTAAPVGPDTVRADGAASVWGEQALRRLIRLGAYQQATTPAMFVYRMRVADRDCTGVVAEVDVAAFADGRVLGHEDVQPDRVEGLVRHFRAVTARSDLVALIHQGTTGYDHALEAVCAGPPALDVAGPEGVQQTAWWVSDPADQAIFAAALGRGPSYIADGHHRVAAALRYTEQEQLPAGHGVLSIFYTQAELRPLAFHRRVAGPVPADTFLSALEPQFRVEPEEAPGRQPGGFDLYLRRRWWSVRPLRPSLQPGAAGLDVTLLHRRVLEPLLGLTQVTDPRLEPVSELTPLAEVLARCDQDGGALFLLVPPTVGQIIEVADRGEVMIPKTTYFDPKPFSGVFLQLPAQPE
jgi:uncharacterized protein (DUF1015 family)